MGFNARAALLTRGLAEMTRLGLQMGGRAETLGGLSGVGDLILTCTGDLSRNRQVGMLLAQGKSLPPYSRNSDMSRKVFIPHAKCIWLLSSAGRNAYL